MSKIRKNLKARSGVDLTPMVDVIFLLIIFFLSSFSLSKNRAYKVTLPNAEAASKVEKNLPVLTLKKNGTFSYQNETIEEADLEDFLISQIVDKENANLVIAGDKDIAYQRIIDVMSLSKKVGINQVSLKVDVERDAEE